VIRARTAANSRVSTSFATLVEGFQQFDNDLNKLQVSARPSAGGVQSTQELTSRQQFVEVNETAISKILKKVRRLTFHEESEADMV